MNKPVHPVALFRLSVLGPLTSRQCLQHGELREIVRELAKQTYQIPGSQRVHLGEKTIEQWYYAWRKDGIDGLAPKERKDKGQSRLESSMQALIISTKQANPARSVPMLIHYLELRGDASSGQLARSTVHRLLQQQGLSSRMISGINEIERRAFEAIHAGDIWYGDVMHGPKVQTEQGQRKTYLVTIIDDASRLVCHSKFCLDETAISIEYVLKEALLKRGLPKKLIVDNGPAYRSGTLQSICARLKIRLIYGRPYEPQSKGKLERWHRTVREQFLAECDLSVIHSLDEFNSRLWLWVERFYHQTIHTGLAEKMTPLERYHQDLQKIQPLGPLADKLDDYFYHRISRRVKKDGTISWNHILFEVSCQFVGKKIHLVVNPHTQQACWIESMDYEYLGEVALLDKQANLSRKRHRPVVTEQTTLKKTSLVEILYEQSSALLDITDKE